MKKKRALVIGGGAYYSAYDAGVAYALCRELGGDYSERSEEQGTPYFERSEEQGTPYFDAAYSCSVGTYIATYFMANRPDAIEYVWKNCVDGRKFFDYTNPLRNCRILNLEYLNSICPKFDIGAVLQRASLSYVLTRYPTGEADYVKPQMDTIFDLMKASSAIPLLHPPVTVDGVAYIDGGFSDPLPFAKARADGYDDITVIYNEPEGRPESDRYDMISGILALFLPRKI